MTIPRERAKEGQTNLVYAGGTQRTKNPGPGAGSSNIVRGTWMTLTNLRQSPLRTYSAKQAREFRTFLPPGLFLSL